MKICRFHSQMQFSADFTPEVIDAPAPRNEPCRSDLRRATERTRASRESLISCVAAKRDRTLRPQADELTSRAPTPRPVPKNCPQRLGCLALARWADEQTRRNAGVLWKPSDGLEPSTPSLPWRCSTS